MFCTTQLHLRAWRQRRTELPGGRQDLSSTALAAPSQLAGSLTDGPGLFGNGAAGTNAYVDPVTGNVVQATAGKSGGLLFGNGGQGGKGLDAGYYRDTNGDNVINSSDQYYEATAGANGGNAGFFGNGGLGGAGGSEINAVDNPAITADNDAQVKPAAPAAGVVCLVALAAVVVPAAAHKQASATQMAETPATAASGSTAAASAASAASRLRQEPVPIQVKRTLATAATAAVLPSVTVAQGAPAVTRTPRAPMPYAVCRYGRRHDPLR